MNAFAHQNIQQKIILKPLVGILYRCLVYLYALVYIYTLIFYAYVLNAFIHTVVLTHDCIPDYRFKLA